MTRDQSAWAKLEQDLKYTFKNRDLLLQALTHSTYAYEHRDQQLINNERLEFLGDAVLDLAISEALYQADGRHDEGFMTKTRSLLVCENSLADLARELNVGGLLMLGKGETATGGCDKPSNLSNAMEAILGAIHLDSGFTAACQVIADLYRPSLEKAMAGQIVHDYKSRLLEMVQATHGGSSVRFVILAEDGPVHARVFTAGVCLDDRVIAQGQGSSKKEAEQQAAEKAIDLLDCDRRSCTVLE